MSRSAPPRTCPDRLNVLLVGGGGREHALAWRLRESPRVRRLWRTDDRNAGLLDLADPCPVEMDLARPFHFQRWLDEQAIDLVVVGPEQPLADGIADVAAKGGRLVFGPPRAGARLEADKAFAKTLMRQCAVPTAEGRTFDHLDAAVEFVRHRGGACVVKAAGLAAGKGVVVCDDEHEAIAALERIMGDRAFGAAGATVVVEDRLEGQEVSVLALVDGSTIWVLDPAQDHKQVGEGDTGPNTGGMGAYCPTPVIDEATLGRVERDVLLPIVDGMRREGIDYRGVLYAGLMLTAAGPRVLEFNCRFGDPECQPLMARLRGDLAEICWATAAGRLDGVSFDFDPRTACSVVVCSEGYPGEIRTGRPITGLDEAAARPDVRIFHGGTSRDEDGTIRTAGGRVVAVTALGGDLQQARDRANEAAALVRFDGAFFRHDIGDRVLART